MVQAHIHFSGTVQGVGFRYTTLSFAQELALAGWVKNLPDGRVEALVEGERAQIEELLSKLKNEFRVRDVHVDWMPSRNEFVRFSIV